MGSNKPLSILLRVPDLRGLESAPVKTKKALTTNKRKGAMPANQSPNRTGDSLLRAILAAQSAMHLAQESNQTASGPRLTKIHQVDGEPAQIHPAHRHRHDFEILGLQEVFHPQALMQFFQTINAYIQIGSDQNFSTESPYEVKLENNRIGEIYQRIAKVWEEKGLVDAKELLKELSSEFGDIDPEIFNSSLAPHPLTGLRSKFSAPIEIAHAHAYAIKTQKPVSVIFGDESNVGGSNKLFRKLLLSDLMLTSNEGKLNREIWTRLGVSNAEIDLVEERITASKVTGQKLTKHRLQQISAAIREKAANTLTDWVSRAMMHEVKAAFRETMPEIYEQIKFNGLGGDEIVILVPEETERTKLAIHEANKRVAKLIKGLGLNHHEHLKKGKSPGMGLTLLIRSLNDQELKLETVTEKEDIDLEAANTEAKFEHDDLTAIDYARLTMILDRLPEQLNPSRDKAQYTNLGKFDRQKQNDPNYLTKYQLYNVYNHDSGATDISALAQSFDPNKHHALVAINLMNLAAINDNLNQESANKYQREFTNRVSAIPEFAGAEVFSAGPGKLYLLLENNVDKEIIDKQIKEIVDDFNSRNVVDKNNKACQIADLKNSENSNFKGLHYVMVNPGISADVDIHQIKEDTKSMLDKKVRKYLTTVLRRVDTKSVSQPHIFGKQTP